MACELVKRLCVCQMARIVKHKQMAHIIDKNNTSLPNATDDDIKSSLERNSPVPEQTSSHIVCPMMSHKSGITSGDQQTGRHKVSDSNDT